MTATDLQYGDIRGLDVILKLDSDWKPSTWSKVWESPTRMLRPGSTASFHTRKRRDSKAQDLALWDVFEKGAKETARRTCPT